MAAKFPEPVELRIESVGARGDGLARLGDTPVFVPFTLPGERVLASIDAEARRRLGRPGRAAAGHRPRTRRAAVPAFRRMRRLRASALVGRKLLELEDRTSAHHPPATGTCRADR